VYRVLEATVAYATLISPFYYYYYYCYPLNVSLISCDSSH